jgi:hypothetical protein
LSLFRNISGHTGRSNRSRGARLKKLQSAQTVESCIFFARPNASRQLQFASAHARGVKKERARTPPRLRCRRFSGVGALKSAKMQNPKFPDPGEASVARGSLFFSAFFGPACPATPASDLRRNPSAKKLQGACGVAMAMTRRHRSDRCALSPSFSPERFKVWRSFKGGSQLSSKVTSISLLRF